MTELKTLKDLGEREMALSVYQRLAEEAEMSPNGELLLPCRIYTEIELRHTAIKWIKMLRAKRKSLTSDREIAWNEGRQLIMEEFFNITEEDLK